MGSHSGAAPCSASPPGQSAGLNAIVLHRADCVKPARPKLACSSSKQPWRSPTISTRRPTKSSLGSTSCSRSGSGLPAAQAAAAARGAGEMSSASDGAAATCRHRRRPAAIGSAVDGRHASHSPLHAQHSEQLAGARGAQHTFGRLCSADERPQPASEEPSYKQHVRWRLRECGGLPTSAVGRRPRRSSPASPQRRLRHPRPRTKVRYGLLLSPDQVQRPMQGRGAVRR